MFRFREVSASAAVASGNLTLNDAGQEGDLLVASISFRSNVAFTLPSGWTIVAQESAGNTTTTSTSAIGAGLMAFIRRGASAPDLTFLRTGGDAAIGVVEAFIPPPGTTSIVLDGSSANTLGANSTTVTTASITTLTQNADLLVMAACQPSDGVNATAYQTGDGQRLWTERVDVQTTLGGDCGLEVADSIWPNGTDATGTLTYINDFTMRSTCIVGAFKAVCPVPKPRERLRVDITPALVAATPTVVTGSFTPDADSLLIAEVFYRTASGTTATMVLSDSVGLTWTSFKKTVDTAFYSDNSIGVLEVWYAYPGGSPASMTLSLECDRAATCILQLIEVMDAATSSPIGAEAESAHITDAATITLDATPADYSLIVQALTTFDANGGAGTQFVEGDDFRQMRDATHATLIYNYGWQARFGGTSTACDINDAMVGVTVATTDLTITQAYEIKSTWQVVTQSSRHNNVATIPSGSVSSARVLQSARTDNVQTIPTARANHGLTQAARVDNAQVINAGRVDSVLLQTARVDNVETIGAGTIGTIAGDLTQGARVDNTETVFAGDVVAAASLTQASRTDNGQTIGASDVTTAAVVTQGARVDNAQAINAGGVTTAGGVSQASRVDNVSSVPTATLTAAAHVAQASRVDNAQTIGAGSVGLHLVASARFDNAQAINTGLVALAIAQASRTNNGQTINAGAVAQTQTVTAQARVANVATVHAGQVAAAAVMAQAQRVDNVSTVSAATLTAAGQLAQSARVNSAGQIFAAQLDAVIVQGARFDNAVIIAAGSLAQSTTVVQASRVNNTSAIYAGQFVAGGDLQQAARVDNASAVIPAVVFKSGAYEALRAWFAATWTATAKRFENETADPPAAAIDGEPAPFVFMEMLGDFWEMAEITGEPETAPWREEGVALFHVLVPSNTGALTLRGWAEDLTNALSGLTLAEGFTIEDLSVGDGAGVDVDGNYSGLVVSADWSRETIF